MDLREERPCCAVLCSSNCGWFPQGEPDSLHGHRDGLRAGLRDAGPGCSGEPRLRQTGNRPDQTFACGSSSFASAWNLLLLPPCVGGEGAADLSTRGHHPAQSHDWRSLSQRGGRRDRNLLSLQQFAGECVQVCVWLREKDMTSMSANINSPKRYLIMLEYNY